MHIILKHYVYHKIHNKPKSIKNTDIDPYGVDLQTIGLSQNSYGVDLQTIGLSQNSVGVETLTKVSGYTLYGVDPVKSEFIDIIKNKLKLKQYDYDNILIIYKLQRFL